MYLFAEGDSLGVYQEILRYKLRELQRPLNIVSFDAANSSTVTYFKEVAQETGGRFELCSLFVNCDSFEKRLDYKTSLSGTVVARSGGKL